MRRFLLRALGALACLVGPASAMAQSFQTGTLGDAHLFRPAAEARAMIVLFSDASGWSQDDRRLAASLADDGAIVVGVDLPSYLATLEATSGDCAYLVSDIESLSQQMQRAAGGAVYVRPILAGQGAGGALALAIVAQTPADTIGRTLAVDPQVGIALRKPLCTGAPRQVADDRTIYGLSPGPLPDPVDLVFTPAASDAARAEAETLRGQGFAIEMSEATDAPSALAAALHDLAAEESPAEPEGIDLPLVELGTTPRYDTMAIVYSGDGGWRDLDKTIAGLLQGQGVPTVGIDSLRYFWSKKTRPEIAADLRELIDTYTRKWGVSHVMLVGYSFGADMLPLAYNDLSPQERAPVAQISLLGLSSAANLEITVTGLLGAAADDAVPTLAEIARIDPRLLQCIYGADEHESACPQLAGTPIEMIETTGGHHFDGDYAALTQKLVSGLQRRLAAAPPATIAR